MADWNEPTIDSTYEDFVNEVRARDEDAARMFEGGEEANLPVNTKRWNDNNNRFEKWDGSAWVALKLGIAGGGMGADTASGARTNLGLGSAATRAVGVGDAEQVPDRGAADGRYVQRGNNLSDLGDAAAARENLGLSSPAAADDFLVGGLSPARWVRKTLSQTKAILGLVLTQTAEVVGFTIVGGVTPKTLTVDEDVICSQLGGKSTQRFHNLALAASVSAKALSISIKGEDGNDPTSSNAVKIAFRSPALAAGTPNVRSVVGAMSLTLSSGSTLGFSAAETGRIYVYGIDQDGTVELALSRTAMHSEAALITTTAEGGAGGADATTVMYSATARSNVPCRCLGYVEIETGAVAGEWDNAPTQIQVMGPGIKRTGDVIQEQVFSNATNHTLTTMLPFDNTIPQITEGDQILAGSYTPKSALNILHFEFTTNVTVNVASGCTVALFEGSSVNALAAVGITPVASYFYPLLLKHSKPAGVDVATTYQVRGGPGAAQQLYTLRYGSLAGFGGVSRNVMKITEVVA